MIYTSDLLLNSIKTRAMIPQNQSTFTDDDLLNLANEEMEAFITGTLLRVHEEYLVVTEQIPIVADQTRYRIPYRAIGQKVRDVTYTVDNTTVPVPRFIREQVPVNVQLFNTLGFYVEGNYIVLLNASSFSRGTLDISYFLRPGKIVSVTGYTTVSSVDTSTSIVTMSANLNAFVVGALVDIITSQSGSETVVLNAEITAVDTVNMTITLDADLSLVGAGDYVCLAGESAVPQCPEEMHPLLAQRVVCRVLEALNDQNGLAAASAKLQEMEKNILALIDNRVVGKPLKVVNRSGLLRSSTLFGTRLFR